MDETAIRTDVELKLRRAGIRVLTEEKRLKTPGAPRLNIAVIAELSTDGLSYTHFVVVKLDQDVRLERDLSERAFGATTWSSDFQVGFWPRADLRTLRDDIKDKVDQFISAYLSVNPKLGTFTRRKAKKGERITRFSRRPGRKTG